MTCEKRPYHNWIALSNGFSAVHCSCRGNQKGLYKYIYGRAAHRRNKIVLHICLPLQLI